MPRLSGPLCAIICAFVLSAACSAPPQKEIDRAQQAIDSARVAGADRYAPAAYAAATSALQQAHEAVAQRDYRLALSARGRRQRSGARGCENAADNKALARSASEAAVSRPTPR